LFIRSEVNHRAIEEEIGEGFRQEIVKAVSNAE